jgi:hypothetical protein
MRGWLVLGVLSSLSLTGCDNGPAPEGFCTQPADCPPETPLCATSRFTCTHHCRSSAECEDLIAQTTCDSRSNTCDGPCTGDALGVFACVEGDRIYCTDDPTLSCAICPNVCGTTSFCDGTSCQPRRAADEPCTANDQCSSAACTAGGRCSALQGEACTADSCDGVCAEAPSGDTFCIRSRCPSDCASSTAGGFEWYCAQYISYQACVPRETCVWEAPCSTFLNATCGQSCRSGAGCWTYCVPNEISNDI